MLLINILKTNGTNQRLNLTWHGCGCLWATQATLAARNIAGSNCGSPEIETQQDLVNIDVVLWSDWRLPRRRLLSWRVWSKAWSLGRTNCWSWSSAYPNPTAHTWRSFWATSTFPYSTRWTSKSTTFHWHIYRSPIHHLSLAETKLTYKGVLYFDKLPGYLKEDSGKKI